MSQYVATMSASQAMPVLHALEALSAPVSAIGDLLNAQKVRAEGKGRQRASYGLAVLKGRNRPLQRSPRLMVALAFVLVHPFFYELNRLRVMECVDGHAYA